MNKKGIFITFEGTEGSGKTTHAKKLTAYLRKKGFSVVFTREPGGTKLAEGIRNIVLNKKESVVPLAELMLYEASRAQHIEELIKPNLDKGKIVICDRFTDSTIAYQSFGRGLDIKVIAELNKIVTRDAEPDLTIFIDLPVEKGLKRARAQLGKDGANRLENESIKFHKKVKKGFQYLLKSYPNRIKLVRQDKDSRATFAKICNIVDTFLK
ncbi:MAG: dTMP kinase [bacterium]